VANRLTPAAVRDRLDLAKVDTVYHWIAIGALEAVNVAAGTGRKTWRISEEALQRFIESRTSTPVPKAGPRRREKPRPVTQYF
jgi:hypothetical protein